MKVTRRFAQPRAALRSRLLLAYAAGEPFARERARGRATQGVPDQTAAAYNRCRMSEQPCHVVRVSRRKQFSSGTLSAAGLGRLEAAFRVGPWYRDRWVCRQFREAALHELEADGAGGLVLIGSGLSFDTPPPFVERFEPVPLADFLGETSEQLKVLSGPAATREERIRRYILIAVGVLAVVGAAALLAGHLRGLPPALIPVTIGMAVLIAVIINLALALQRFWGRWFLVPAGIAIVGGLHHKRGQVTLLTRWNSYAYLRLVHTGKTVLLMLEVVARSGRRYRRNVSEREALGFLAAWQSPQPPPLVGQLQELAGGPPEPPPQVSA